MGDRPDTFKGQKQALLGSPDDRRPSISSGGLSRGRSSRRSIEGSTDSLGTPRDNDNVSIADRKKSAYGRYRLEEVRQNRLRREGRQDPRDPSVQRENRRQREREQQEAAIAGVAQDNNRPGDARRRRILSGGKSLLGGGGRV